MILVYENHFSELLKIIKKLIPITAVRKILCKLQTIISCRVLFTKKYRSTASTFDSFYEHLQPDLVTYPLKSYAINVLIDAV